MKVTAPGIVLGKGRHTPLCRGKIEKGDGLREVGASSAGVGVVDHLLGNVGEPIGDHGEAAFFNDLLSEALFPQNKDQAVEVIKGDQHDQTAQQPAGKEPPQKNGNGGVGDDIGKAVILRVGIFMILVLQKIGNDILICEKLFSIFCHIFLRACVIGYSIA